jgi:hypothetical protein
LFAVSLDLFGFRLGRPRGGFHGGAASRRPGALWGMASLSLQLGHLAVALLQQEQPLDIIQHGLPSMFREAD